LHPARVARRLRDNAAQVESFLRQSTDVIELIGFATRNVPRQQTRLGIRALSLLELTPTATRREALRALRAMYEALPSELMRMAEAIENIPKRCIGLLLESRRARPRLVGRMIAEVEAVIHSRLPKGVQAVAAKDSPQQRRAQALFCTLFQESDPIPLPQYGADVLREILRLGTVDPVLAIELPLLHEKLELWQRLPASWMHIHDRLKGRPVPESALIGAVDGIRLGAGAEGTAVVRGRTARKIARSRTQDIAWTSQDGRVAYMHTLDVRTTLFGSNYLRVRPLALIANDEPTYLDLWHLAVGFRSLR
jgi:hypothetical protein